MIKFNLIIIILLIYTGLFGYSENDPIKLGFLGDFSSFSKAYTENMYLAAQLSVSELNEQDGFSGRRIELIKRDGGNEPQKHYDLVVQLIKEEKVVAIFGGASSPAVLKASAACKEFRIPYLVSIGNSQSLIIENGHPYIFQFQPTLTMETKGFSIFTTLMPWKRYAWIGPDYTWGHDVLRDFKQQFVKIGKTLKWTTEAWHPLGTTDFKTIIDKILKGKPDALVIGSWGEDVRLFMIQAQARGLFEKIAVFGWFSYDMNGEMGRIVPEGMWCLARGGPFNYLAKKFPRTKQMVDNFYKSYDTYPVGYAICCYDSFLAWWQAVCNAKTIDPEAVALALRGMKFQGLRGDSFIREIDGQLNCSTYFGRLVYQEDYPFAVWDSIIEITAEKTWLTEEEILSIRGK